MATYICCFTVSNPGLWWHWNSSRPGLAYGSATTVLARGYAGTDDEHEAIGGASCSEATVLSEAGHLIILSRVTGLSANTKPQGKTARGRKPNDYGTASLTGCT